MTQSRRFNFDTGTLVVGVFLGLMIAVLPGAAPKTTADPRICPLGFVVIEATPESGTAAACQSYLLKVSPRYGKIPSDSLKKRLESESQEFSLRIMADPGTKLECNLQRGDLIAFNSLKVTRGEPGSTTYRYLRSGELEPIVHP